MAITPITVRRVSRRDLMSAFSRYPRIAASLFLSAQSERVALMESLALVVQTDGQVRIAGMLIHLFDRLTKLGLTKTRELQFPLTQAQIGDLVGLSVVHVSRKLCDMERNGLILRRPKTIILLDLDRLRAMSSLPAHRLVHGPDWIGLA